MDGIDDDLIENYLGITADESKPKKVYLSERRAPIWKYALVAAAAVCVIAAGVFAAVKLRGVQLVNPNNSTFSSSGVSISESSDNSDSSSTVIEEGFLINQEIISELGMTYLQLVEKYGEPLNTSGYNKGYKFKDGNGMYRFLFYDNFGNIGVCDMIDAIKAENLLSGVSFPIKIDEMESKYGFICVYTDSEPTLYDCYWTCFTRPDYPNIEFVFYLNEYGFIIGDTGCIIQLKGIDDSESSTEINS